MKQSRLFELEYKELMDKFSDESWVVESPGYLIDQTTGEKREIDVLIIRYINGVKRKIGIECRNRGRVQGIDWIEEFSTKKDDVGLDILILSSTSGFSETAIRKARSHGIILEKAERINNELVRDCSNVAYINNYFLYYVVTRIQILTKDNKIVNIKEFLNSLNLINQHKLLYEINDRIYLNFCVFNDQIRESVQLENLGFFDVSKNSVFSTGYSTSINENNYSFLYEMGVRYIALDVDARPVVTSIPLQKSLALMYADSHRNKRYDGHFSNEDDTFSISYSEENEIVVNYTFKKRKYLRYVGGEMVLNTVVPDEKVLPYIDFSDLINNVLGSFDLSKVI